MPHSSVATANTSGNGNGGGNKAKKSTARLVEKIGKTLDKISSSPSGKQQQQQQQGRTCEKCEIVVADNGSTRVLAARLTARGFWGEVILCSGGNF